MAEWVVALKVLLPAGENLYGNRGDTDDSPVFLSSRDSLAYLSNATSLWSELNQ